MLDQRLQQTQLTPDDWILGELGAPATLLEYGDFECPFCAATRPVLEGLVAERPDTIRLVYRHFPITSIHPHAFLAAEAAEAAGAQGLFWEMHDELYQSQDALTYADLRFYADALGLDLARFDEEMAAHRYRDEVWRDFRRGVQDGVNGTPALFINGRRHDGPRDRLSILAAIAAHPAAQAHDPGMHAP
jgi:protein-disulfide isomerase